MQNHNDKRTIFDWLIFTLIHLVVIFAIGYAGIQVYGQRLGLWVAASATVAGFASCYLFAKDVPGETLMKVWLYLCVAANAGYLVHNGARNIGIQGYNAAQVEKFERGMAEAGKVTSRRIARELRLAAESASKVEAAFSDGVSVIVAILAFLELFSALLVFAMGSRRIVNLGPAVTQQRQSTGDLQEIEARQKLIDEINEIRAYQTGRLKELEGKDYRQ